MDPPGQWPRPRGAPRPEELDRPLESLSGVGKTIAARLRKVGLETVGDVLLHRPRRYEQPVATRTILQLFGEDEAVLEAVVRTVRSRRRGRLHILTARVADETGEVDATWFNQPWLESRLVPGTRVRLRGQRNRYGFAVSSYDLEGEEAQTADFAPVYPSSEDLAQKTLRTLAETALEHARDVWEELPASCSSPRDCHSAPTRCTRSTAHARSTRPRPAGAGSPSTSCCCSSSRSLAAPSSARPPSPSHCPRRAS